MNKFTEEHFNDLVEDLLERLSLPGFLEKGNFLSTPFENLIEYHYSMGRWIRNVYNLWEYEWEPEVVDGVDLSESHPDFISMRAIEAVWKRMKLDESK